MNMRLSRLRDRAGTYKDERELGKEQMLQGISCNADQA
jgi:hypothetical protein